MISEDINVGAISEALNNKMDRDTLNASDTGKIQMSGMGMPSNKYIDLTVNASGASYTAPASGYFAFDSFVSGDWISLNNAYIRALASKGSNTGIDMSGFIPARKGQTVYLSYVGTWEPHSWQSHPFVFIYAVGSESEAS